MAEEAFALSPISARAALPSEEDYAAISEAFMETSRGRWFLGEYAKRNRNADTRMVLDAVTRIEESLGAQRQAAADAVRDEQLAQALAALRGAIEAAQASAIAALDGISFDQDLAPVRKGVRVIKEISWRLREIGNDGRICDIIDSQANAIETGAAQISMDEAKAVLDASFATLARRLSEFDPDKAAMPATETAVVEVQAAEPAATVARESAAAPQADATVAASQPSEAEAKADGAAEAGATELADANDEAAADADDEAVLDLIAMEMGAPDPIDEDEIAEEMRAAEAMAAEPEMEMAALVSEAAHAPDPRAEPTPMAATRSLRPPVTAPPIVDAPVSRPPLSATVEADPARRVSLGSTLIASGLVRKPGAAANDPLAPIRRMSQAEKIAFFS